MIHLIFNNFEKFINQDQDKKNKMPAIFYKTKNNDGHNLSGPGFVLIGTKQGKKNLFEDTKPEGTPVMVFLSGIKTAEPSSQREDKYFIIRLKHSLEAVIIIFRFNIEIRGRKRSR